MFVPLRVKRLETVNEPDPLMLPLRLGAVDAVPLIVVLFVSVMALIIVTGLLELNTSVGRTLDPLVLKFRAFPERA